MIFSWQATQWAQLSRMLHDKRLPHALLFTGLSGIGKSIFADAYSYLLFCQTPVNEMPCYKCHACRLVKGRAHPNVLWIEPEKKGSAIKVDQIRAVTEFINQSSFQGEYRVVIINPANNMNINAANALLKTLEEPSSGALLILVSDLRARLPATILSRCQRIVFKVPPTQLALDWLAQKMPEVANREFLLKMAEGAPLAAVELLEDDIMASRATLFQAFIALSKKQGDPIKTAAGLQKVDELTLIDLALSFVCDLMRLHNGINDIINQDYQPSLLDIQKVKDEQSNHQFLNYLQQLRKQVCEGVNLNKQLLVESILLNWM